MSSISVNAILQRARAAYQRGAWSEASDLAHAALKARKDDIDALVILHMLARVQGDPQQAIAIGQRIIKTAPNISMGYVLLAEFFVACGKFDEGIALLQRWLKKSPKDHDVAGRLAAAYDMKGDAESARSLLQPYLDRGDETPAMALMLASTAIQEKDTDLALRLLTKHLASSSLPDNVRKDMCFVMGLACERNQQIDDAFAWYTRGHQVLPYPFNLENFLDQVERTITTFSKERFARLPRARVRTNMPIFLVCRPRSGSTLAERIIGTHPQVTLAGELTSISRIADQLNLLIGSTRIYPECALDLDQNDVDSLARMFIEQHTAQFNGAPRITIKQLDLWQHLGLISLILPDAAILDLRRDAVDTALACYSVHLGPRQPYNQDLRSLGLVHRAYERLMDHWRETLGINMLQVNYEDVVADQDRWSRRMIEFCGLPWDDQCLRFHETAGTPVGATLSYQQVRQPIYKTSVGRAEKFAKHLGPLREALKGE